jgi:hypothetical protein
MRSNTQRTIVDRLTKALESKGVRLKRSQIIEVAAHAFGHADSNVLAIAAKAGEIDPPEGLFVRPEGRAFSWVQDPNADAAFAVETSKIDLGPTGCTLLSPYGGLITVPYGMARTTWPMTMHVAQPMSTMGCGGGGGLSSMMSETGQMIGGKIVTPLALDGAGDAVPIPTDRGSGRAVHHDGMDDVDNFYQQIGVGLEIVPLDEGSSAERVKGLDKHGLGRFSDLVEVEVRCEPGLNLMATGASLVDGRVNLTFWTSIECDGADMVSATAAEMQATAERIHESIQDTGCMLRWTHDHTFHMLDVELYVPRKALNGLEDGEQLGQAIRSLFMDPTAHWNHHLYGSARRPSEQTTDRMADPETEYENDPVVRTTADERDYSQPFAGTDYEGRPYLQIGPNSPIDRSDPGRRGKGPEGLKRYGLERFAGMTQLETSDEFIGTMAYDGISVMGGRVHLTFTSTYDYYGHYGAIMAIGGMESITGEAGEDLCATGSLFRWTDDSRMGRIEIQLHVPQAAFDHLADEEELEDALLSLLHSNTAYGNHHLEPCGYGSKDGTKDEDPTAYA